MEALKNENSVL